MKGYPETTRSDHIETLHGVEVRDPYRWLEELDSPDTRAWIRAQNEFSDRFFEDCPERDRIRARIEELWRVDRRSVPEMKGGRFFFARLDAGLEQPTYHWAEEPAHEGQLLLDANRLSEDGSTSVSISKPSPDGNLWVYGVSEGGSDWNVWRIRSVEEDGDLHEELRGIKFSTPTWLPDSSGFFYSRYEASEEDGRFERKNRDQKLCFHRVGTPQSEDPLIYERPDHPDWGFEPHVTDDAEYLLVSIWKGTHRERALLLFRLSDVLEDPARALTEVVELRTDFDADYQFLVNEGSVFYFTTDLDAPRQRVVAIDANHPAPEGWKTIVPERDETIELARATRDAIVLVYLKDAHSKLVVHERSGRKRAEVELPELGSVASLSCSRKSSEFYFSFENFLRPTSLFRASSATGRAEEYWAPRLAFDAEAFETRQVFVTSADGTQVPVFLTHRKGWKPDGQAPTYLYGYGGFGVSMTPQFKVDNLVWLELGGLHAHACLRGGGEYGNEWHDAGRLDRKQNVFDDAIAAAEWLIENEYTERGRLSIGGRSNGGLLASACLVQRPDLFGAAVPGVGVLDMLRFHKFTIGWAWVSDYGSPDDPDEFRNLLSYSPYHNIRETEYPPTLIVTADHDDRVHPGHSFKFAAALQGAQRGSAPILLRVGTRAGHGAGRSVTQLIDDAADVLSFLHRVLEMESVSERA